MAVQTLMSKSTEKSAAKFITKADTDLKKSCSNWDDWKEDHKKWLKRLAEDSEEIYFHNGISGVKNVLIMKWKGVMNILFKLSKLGQAVLYENIWENDSNSLKYCSQTVQILSYK